MSTLDGITVLGASGMPAFADLQPYFLTDYPKTGEQLALLYAAYLRAYDNLTSSIYSVFHPASTGAVTTAMQAARGTITELWDKGGASAIQAVQMLAGLMGWFNANYVDGNGNVKWDALNQPVNAGIIKGSQDAAKAVVDTAKAAGKVGTDLLDAGKGAISTVWWTAVIGGGVLVVGIGALLWKSMSSGTAQAVLGARR